MPKSPLVPMKWDQPQLRALSLAFEGRWTQAEIAEKLNEEFGSSAKFRVSARGLRAWLAHPDFQARLAELRANLAHSLADVAYADKGARIIALSQMAEHARREYEAHPLLIERRPAMDGEITNESFNRDAHAAFRDALNDIAKELGERSSNVHITATQQNFGITVVLERMRGDSRIADAAADYVGLIDATGKAGE